LGALGDAARDFATGDCCAGDVPVCDAGKTRATVGPPTVNEVPADGCSEKADPDADPDGVDCRRFAGAVAPCGVVERPMIAGTSRVPVAATLFGVPAVIPGPASNARSQIWNDETTPATTTAAQATHGSLLRT
jgi:hypothetical protein